MDFLEQLESHIDGTGKPFEIRFYDLNIQDQDLSRYEMDYIGLYGCQFQNCNFETVMLNSIEAHDNTFKRCLFRGNRNVKGRMWDDVFEESDIVEMDAIRAEFSGCSFLRMELRDCKLVDCMMDTAKFKQVRFVNCDLRVTDWDRAEFEDVVFENCLFTHKSFNLGVTGVKLVNVSMKIDGVVREGLGDEAMELIANLPVHYGYGKN